MLIGGKSWNAVAAKQEISENDSRSCKVLFKYSQKLISVVDDMWTTKETLWEIRDLDTLAPIWQLSGMLSLLLIPALFSGGTVKTMEVEMVVACIP